MKRAKHIKGVIETIIPNNCFYQIMSELLVFGENAHLIKYLENSIDKHFLFLPLYSLEVPISFGNIVILVSEDIDFIQRTTSSLAPWIPIIVITKRYDWIDKTNRSFLETLPPSPTSIDIKTAIEKAEKAIINYKEVEKELVGISNDVSILRSNIVLSSFNASAVNISGETGTGKTIAARIIHKLSNSRKKKMVYINCANLSSQIIDSELFGHTKGAYTGADSQREGLIEEANDSTLFLDEIGNLTLEQQAKLLDTIEYGRFRRIGENCEKISKFRLITAAQEPLESLLEQKKLREDFYYRISSYSFKIQPLRNHKEDIPYIVKFYEKRNKNIKREINDFTPLMNKDWKGNVRELFHYLDRIFMI